jgi:uncharacterized membrane protein YphA (DoxX/SURF4 family)
MASVHGDFSIYFWRAQSTVCDSFTPADGKVLISFVNQRYPVVAAAYCRTTECISERTTIQISQDIKRNTMQSSRLKQTIGWVLSCLLSLFLAAPSAIGKFVDWEGKQQMFDHLGYTTELIAKIGVVEVVIAILFLIPRTAFIAAILISAYLGGAIATHVRVGDPFIMPIIIGVMLWISLGLRRPEVFSLAFGRKKSSTTSSL